MDVPMSNDFGDICEKNGSGRKTGMHLYMPFVSVYHQFFYFNSEFGREQLLAGSGSPWKPEGTRCTLDVPLDDTIFRCEIYSQRTDIGLCDQLFDLINHLDLLWAEGENVILSVDDSPGVFPRNWLPRGYIIRAYWRLS